MASLFDYVRSVRKSSSFWALSDQTITSGGTFFTKIVVMKAYSENVAEFAVYGLLVSTLELMTNLHASVVTYPLSVKGAPAPDAELRRLTSSSLLLTGFWSIPLLLITAAAAIYLKHVWLFPSVALALLAGQMQETTRRAMMSHLKHHRAIIGDIISYLGQAAVVFALCYHRVPALHEVFLAMAGTSLLAALVQGAQLRITIPTADHVRQLGAAGWKLGRWLLLSNGLNFLTIQLVGWIVYSFHTKEFVAAFYALAMLMGVTHPVMFGISSLIVPGVAKLNHTAGPVAAGRYALKLGTLGLGLLAPFFTFLLIMPDVAIRLVSKSDSPFLEYTNELRLFVLQYLVVYATVVTTGYLNGVEFARFTFFGQFTNAASSVIFRLPVTAVCGMAAAVWSGAITYGLQLLVNVVGIRKVTRRRTEPQDEPVLALEA
jgi:O-antigen/teichoic acid export membrane protein